MATLSSRGDSFKTFLAERKAEYRSKFPFLTESQVVAKLKRVWNNQQARDTQATAAKSSAVDTKSECLNGASSGNGRDKHAREGDSADQSVLMSSRGLPGETLRRKVKPPPLSRSLTRFSVAHSFSTTTTTLSHPLLPSPTNKENTNLPTNSSAANSNSSNSSSSLLATGGGTYSFSSSSSALDCYAFTEDEQQHTTAHVHKRSCYTEGSSSSSVVKDKHQRPIQHVSFSKNSNQNVMELKLSRGSSNDGSSLKGATQLILSNDSASLQTAAASKQVNKKPGSATSTAADAATQGVRKTRSSLRNAVAAATNYHSTATMDSSRVVISTGSAGTVDIRDKHHSLRTHAQAVINRDNVKGAGLSLSDHSTFDSDPSLDQEMGSSETLCTGERRRQEQRQALQPAASAIVDVDLDDECCTMPCSVYNQIMGLALRSSNQTQGNVESGGPLLGLTEHSHGHNINTARSTESVTADLASPVISDALGNPKTESIPTKSSASASGSSPQQSWEPAMCVHNDALESIEVLSSHDDSGTDLVVINSIIGGDQKQRGRGRGRGKGRGRKRRGRGRGKKKDPNESWIHTNSQPQTCDRVEDPLEFSQIEQISCSLPERTPVESQPDMSLQGELASDMIWEESTLPNMVSEKSLPEGGEEERSLRRRGLGTRASFRGRGRKGVRGGGRDQRGRGTMKTPISGRVTRSRTAALLKSKMEEAKDKEKMDFSSELENADIPLLSSLPPAKKQKPKLKHEDSPSASSKRKAECSENNGVTTMDISASSPANTVCGANDGVALSDTGVANSVCGEPRDSSTASALFSTASANSGSKCTPSLAIRPCDEESTLSNLETPLLHATKSMCATATTVAAAGGTGLAASLSGKPCKSSSPSPPFAQCSSVTTTTATSSQPQAQQPSMQLTPIQVDPLCDMFLPLTPERKKSDIYEAIGSFYSEAPTERRTVLPAPAGSEDKGYCLFADDADIFL